MDDILAGIGKQLAELKAYKKIYGDLPGSLCTP
jgi:hypothetical protein